MRNQTWNQQGQLIEDLEPYREASVAKVKDHLTGVVRDATTEEEAKLAAEERQAKKQDAMNGAMQAIRSNVNQLPWGRILYDLAVGQGWIEE